MTAEQAVARYYDAWRTRRGDMSDVPLADDFRFVGPVASFETAEGYREMARQAGQAVTSFAVRSQFVDGNTNSIRRYAPSLRSQPLDHLRVVHFFNRPVSAPVEK